MDAFLLLFVVGAGLLAVVGWRAAMILREARAERDLASVRKRTDALRDYRRTRARAVAERKRRWQGKA